MTSEVMARRVPRMKGRPVSARTIFRILSPGANKIDEHGGGDDVVGEVEKVGNEYRYKTIWKGYEFDDSLDSSQPATTSQ
jgi:hypothetical protein